MTVHYTGFFSLELRGLLLAATTSLLTGCISLFPNAEPAQLYRFGTTAHQIQKAPSNEPRFGVLLSSTGFNRAAANDRILTVTGTQVAYIKDSRWATSAVHLFDSALQQAFETQQGPARLITPGEIAKTEYALKLDVRTFEARYEKGQDTAPTVVVEVHAALAHTHNRMGVGDRSFKASVTASDNRVGAITEAFDQAVAQVLGGLVTWVDSRGEDTDLSAVFLP
jgi:cholesterol transport system auxiliary component